MKILQRLRLDDSGRRCANGSRPMPRIICSAPNVSSRKHAAAVHPDHRIRAGILKWNSLRGVAVEVMVVEDEMRQQCDPRMSVELPAPMSSEGWLRESRGGNLWIPGSDLPALSDCI